MDEFGCLRLNIYTPANKRDGLLLPVVVWIHGGGFVFGDGGPEFDGNALVRHSMDTQNPVVFVALNYRLGYFGFLTSRELQAEAAAAGEVAFTNMAFHDQRVALLWVGVVFDLLWGAKP
jgi:carboxylesterase type B